MSERERCKTFQKPFYSIEAKVSIQILYDLFLRGNSFFLSHTMYTNKKRSGIQFSYHKFLMSKEKRLQGFFEIIIKSKKNVV